MRHKSAAEAAVEETASTLVTEVAASLCVVGLDGTVLGINDAVELALGWKPEECVGMFGPEQVHPDDRARASGQVAALVSGSSAVESGESRVRHKDGSHRWIGWIARANLETGRIYIAGHDVTARRQRLGRIIGESVQTFRAAFDHAPIGIGLADPEGNWIDANDTLCAQLGLSRRELTRSSNTEAMADESFARLQRMLTSEPSSGVLRIRYLRPDGSFLDRRSTVTLVKDPSGSPLHFVCQLHQVGPQSSLASPSPFAGGEHEPKPTPAPSSRELDVLRLAAQGFSTDEIARDLNLSPTTVKTHLQHLYAKLGASNRASAVAEAFKLGLL